MTERSYAELLDRIHAAEKPPEIVVEPIGSFDADSGVYEMVAVRLGALTPGKPRVMVAGGIHGDEPASVEAAVRFIESVSSDTSLLSRASFIVFPCNNPTGWELNTRQNWQGIDLNRQFWVLKPAPEVALIMRALQGRCFDLVFEMHEDIDAPGLYLYEIAEDSSDHVAERIIEAAADAGYPIDREERIERMPAHDGIIRREIKVERFRKTHLPQAIYIYRTCGGHVITLEPPVAMLPLEDRVNIELMALRIALDHHAPSR